MADEKLRVWLLTSVAEWVGLQMLSVLGIVDSPVYTPDERLLSVGVEMNDDLSDHVQTTQREHLMFAQATYMYN